MPISDILRGLKLERLCWFQFMALASFVVLLISLVQPLQETLGVKNKYVAIFSIGCLLYSLIEWTQWFSEYERTRTALIGPFHKKETRVYHIILKIMAIILMLVPIIELITGIKLIPF